MSKNIFSLKKGKSFYGKGFNGFINDPTLLNRSIQCDSIYRMSKRTGPLTLYKRFTLFEKHQQPLIIKYNEPHSNKQ